MGEAGGWICLPPFQPRVSTKSAQNINLALPLKTLSKFSLSHTVCFSLPLRVLFFRTSFSSRGHLNVSETVGQAGHTGQDFGPRGRRRRRGRFSENSPFFPRRFVFRVAGLFFLKY